MTLGPSSHQNLPPNVLGKAVFVEQFGRKMGENLVQSNLSGNSHGLEKSSIYHVKHAKWHLESHILNLIHHADAVV